MKRTFADLFAVPPQTWGARGEPFLWEEMRKQAINHAVAMPSSFEHLVQHLNTMFEELTGHDVNECDWFFVDKYAHGGMSSGHVDPRGWRDEGIILDYIQQSFIRIKIIEEQS